ncbi:signal peptidase I [Magnetospira sp. QH-2]|uniref:signal peptidase I n=1 Tax=Magnetospira sp. (strain QH-2) TaxID=1288970 RepID=UPI0003E80E23|nr:signal peptidase I [Magnetospira sp. QH-2]CCQ73574.1 Signal peptidase I (SPase I) (Leader peptidase I) [Magnetospira sp. QH-2]
MVDDLPELSSEEAPGTSPADAGGWGETVRTIAYALGIAVLIRTFAYEPFSIPSGSMIPTLLVGDHLFVSKLSYGYSRYSLPFGVPLIPGRILSDDPVRGDVAVFRKPTDTNQDYIKRIVGLPGDRLQVVRGILHINGEPVKRKRIEDFIDRSNDGSVKRIPQYLETLPNGVEHRILEAWGDHGPADNTPVFKVPDGHYFGMGDNRDNSTDSRFPDVGFIPAQNLVGRADVMFFSKTSDMDWWELWKLPANLRYDRFFMGID